MICSFLPLVPERGLVTGTLGLLSTYITIDEQAPVIDNVRRRMSGTEYSSVTSPVTRAWFVHQTSRSAGVSVCTCTYKSVTSVRKTGAVSIILFKMYIIIRAKLLCQHYVPTLIRPVISYFSPYLNKHVFLQIWSISVASPSMNGMYQCELVIISSVFKRARPKLWCPVPFRRRADGDHTKSHWA